MKNLLTWQKITINTREMELLLDFNIEKLIFLVFIGSFVLSYFTIPKIRRVVLYKKLMDFPGKRSSHSDSTPTLAGVAFFFTLIFSLYAIQFYDTDKISLSIVTGVTILLFVGLKDDLVVISPWAKIIGQLVAIFFILLDQDFVISNLNGFLGIYEIPYLLSIFLSVFLMLIIINAFNLIDGIDGLAAIIGIIIFSIFSVIYYYALDYFFLLIGITMIGSLAAFLRFNFSSKKKIFMGDTGSLIIGLMIAIFTLRFLSLEEESFVKLPFLFVNAPLIVFSILIIPILDTTRVFTIRLLNKKSPFSPDRNHIHHVLIDFGFTHKKASFIIGIVNLIIVAIILSFASFSKESIRILFLSLLIAAIFYFILSRISKKNRLLKEENEETSF